MIDKFELLLDLLDIEDKNNYIEIAKLIETKKYKNIKTLHKHGFIFELFNDFLDNKISLEEFVKIWDIEWWVDIIQLGFDLNSLYTDNVDLADTLFIVSLVNLSRKFSKKEIDKIKEKLASVNSQLCII